MRLTIDDIKIMVNECVQQLLERKVVTFGGQTYPKFGWAVIMAGGAGSGKSYIQSHHLPIDGRVINKDDIGILLQKLHPDMIKNFDREREGHIRTLNKQVRKGQYAEKNTSNLVNNANPNRLPNIIIDTTSSDEQSLNEKVSLLKNSGYKICFVWVVTNRSEALVRSLSRGRRVPQSTFHSTHNKVPKIVPKFLENNNNAIDEAWIILNSGPDLHTERPDEFLFKLEKTGNGFLIPNELKETIKQYVGMGEVSPYGPDVYYQYNDIINNFAEVDDNGHVKSIDRSKLPKNLYKQNPVDRKLNKPINNPFLK